MAWRLGLSICAHLCRYMPPQCDDSYGMHYAVQTLSNAAGVLYQMSQAPEYMHVMSARLAASRLVPLMARAMEDGTPGG